MKTLHYIPHRYFYIYWKCHINSSVFVFLGSMLRDHPLTPGIVQTFWYLLLFSHHHFCKGYIYATDKDTLAVCTQIGLLPWIISNTILSLFLFILKLTVFLLFHRGHWNLSQARVQSAWRRQFVISWAGFHVQMLHKNGFYSRMLTIVPVRMLTF